MATRTQPSYLKYYTGPVYHKEEGEIYYRYFTDLDVYYDSYIEESTFYREIQSSDEIKNLPIGVVYLIDGALYVHNPIRFSNHEIKAVE